MRTLHIFYNIYLFVVALGLCCCVGFSLVAVNEGGSSPVVGRGLLIVVTSPGVKHGLQGEWNSVAVACGSNNCSSQVLEHRLNSCGTWA